MAENPEPESNIQESYNENIRKWKKRPCPPVFNGLGSHEDKDNDFLCSICFEMICEAHMTKCGHTFCLKCISTSLEYNKRCPRCNFLIENASEIFPNFMLNELIAKHKSKCPNDKKRKYSMLQNSGSLNDLQELLSKEKANLTVEEINAMLEVLAQKKQQLEADCIETQMLILKEFLELRTIQQQLKVIEKDSLSIEDLLSSHMRMHVQNSNSYQNNSSSSSSNHLNNTKPEPSTSKNCNFDKLCNIRQDAFNGSKYVNKLFTAPTLASRRKRVHEHFDDLKCSYLNYRSKDIYGCLNGGEITKQGLDAFHKDLGTFTRFNSVRCLATLNYSSDSYVGSNIVSSIEFDKDNEYFAIAGVTKKIKVFEFAPVIQDVIDMHYPATEMVCNSKISCITWSSFHKNMLGSSDYEGTVSIWDAFTNTKLKVYQEHEKRCWSVDFNRVDAHLIASGSDDAKRFF
ncbi:e3 ubiquitin-protein ligase COP1 [Caerostris extrusa]|uniref:E3 ubiquitin-protein ligase COP1 n=1 Tax=Caerostris extrusa TaxID=172846 RepID=A0AAV4XPZ4_CAEEX|nr:e3 ubiquitin-protein ligase COP1 [Caerostris extrusa]